MFRTKPISWSELFVYEKDKAAWYDQFVLGVSVPPTPIMVRGSDIHEYVLLGKEENALNEETYSKKEIVIHKAIKEAFDQLFERSSLMFEGEITGEIGGVPIKGILDAQDNKFNAVIELKTGEKIWTPWRVINHGQLDTYAALYNDLYEEIPLVVLVSASTKTGEVSVFEKEVKPHDIDAIIKRFQRAWMDVRQYQPYVKHRQ